jgi:adenine-specific DNA-methyltransferase
MELLSAFVGVPEVNRVYNVDALTLLRAMPSASVGLIAVDWPYNMDKADWDTWETDAQYLDWMRPHLAEMKRVLKPNGSYYGFASAYLGSRVEILTADYFNVLNRITWRKPPYSTKAEMFDKDIMRGYFPASEVIVFAEQYGSDEHAAGEAGFIAAEEALKRRIFGDYLRAEFGRAGVNNRQVAALFPSITGGLTGCVSNWLLGLNVPTPDQYQIMRDYLNRASVGEFLRTEYEELRTEYEFLRTEYEELRRPFNVSADVPYTDVWDFATVNTYPGKHPCEKPAAMMQHIINASSRAGDLVLDCFAGSGATLAAAYQLGRDYIGCDMDANWVQVARNRCVKEFGSRRRNAVTVIDDLPLFAARPA